MRDLEKHRESSRLRMAELRAERKAHGLCIYCGKPLIHDRTMCSDCTAYYASINRRRYHRLKKERSNFKTRDTLHESAVNRFRLFMGIAVVALLISLGCICTVVC